MGVYYTAWAAVSAPRLPQGVCRYMIAVIRKYAKSWLALVLFIPLIIGFAIFGVSGDLLRGQVSTYVLKAGSRTVSPVEFKREFGRYLQNLEQRFQQRITPEMAVAENVDKRMLEELALRESFSELLARAGVGASDKLFNDQLRQEPAFFNQVTGAFDPERYQAQLAENGMTPEAYRTALSDAVGRQQFVAASTLGFNAPYAYSALAAVFGSEQRDLAFFVVDPASVGPVPAPTEADFQTFIKENKARLTLPEFRALTLVRFSRTAQESTVTVDPADIEKQWAFQKDSLSKPELRTVLQIPVKDAAQAQQVIAGIKGGKSPNVVAGALGVQPVRYDDKPRSAFFDRAIGDAAFSTPAGGVSAPVKGEFGLAVVAVIKVTPGQTASLEDHRAEIVAKLRTDLAGQKITTMTETYDDAISAGASPAEAAAKAGAQVVMIPPVSADGRGQNGQPIPGLSPAILKAAFELPQGEAGEIQEASEGEYYALRVERVVAPALPPLEAIRPAVMRNIALKKTADAMQARADALAARVRKGESLEAVAASAGARVVRVSGISRASAQQHQALGRDLLGGALGGKKGEVFTAPGGGGGFGIAVAVVTQIRPGDARQIAQITQAQRPQFAQTLFGDIGASAQTFARTTLKTRAYPDRARAALGVDPAQAGEQGDGAAAPASKGQ